MSTPNEPASDVDEAGVPELTVPEAIAGVLVAAVAANGILEPAERVRISDVLATANVLRQALEGPIQRLGERAIALVSTHGLPALLTACAKTIPPDLRPTTFALAADLVLADGLIDAPERTFLDQLQAVLRIDQNTAAKIIDVLEVKNRG